MRPVETILWNPVPVDNFINYRMKQIPKNIEKLRFESTTRRANDCDIFTLRHKLIIKSNWITDAFCESRHFDITLVLPL